MNDYPVEFRPYNCCATCGNEKCTHRWWGSCREWTEKKQ